MKDPDRKPKESTASERKILDDARHARFALAKRLFDEVRGFQSPETTTGPAKVSQNRL